MKLARNLVLLSLCLLAACESMGKTVNDMAQSVNIGAMLASITDGQSATEAKPALDGAVAQLSAALKSAAGDATSSAEAKTAEGTSMMNSVLAQFGIGPETTGTITSLLAIPEVKSVLGGTLQQLMGMITG
jgi:hypothetical protein